MEVEEIYKVKATIELEVPKDMVEDVGKLREELIGEFVKVKGGPYENAAFGFITNVEEVTSGTREWE